LRILYVHRQAGPSTGGGWRALRRMAQGVRALGHHASLLLTGDPLELDAAEWDAVRSLPLPAARKARSLLRYPLNIARLRRLLVAHAPDVVHLNDLEDAPYFALAGPLAGVPVLGHVRVLLEPGRFRKLGAPRLSALACVSEEAARRAAAGGVPADRILVLHDPPDARWFAPPPAAEVAAWRERLSIPAGAPLIGTVGNISRMKGTDVLVEALPLVAARVPGVRCVVVGADDHGMREELAQRAGALGVGDRLLFTGPVADPRAIVAMLDLFVLPSREEGYGLALLEAMAAGKPVAASRVGGIPDIAPGDDAARLVPPADPGALGKAVADLLEDAPLRAAIAAAGHARARALGREDAWQPLCARYAKLAGERGA
jgi:glycosyltransferase involved in cell wall biosynthesis